jgi:hypothetical protein
MNLASATTTLDDNNIHQEKIIHAMERKIFSPQTEEAGHYYSKRFNLINANTYFDYYRKFCEGEYFGTPRIS